MPKPSQDRGVSVFSSSRSDTPRVSRGADPWEDTATLRLRKPGWRDPRLLIGLGLLALGIGSGSIVVNSANKTVPVYTLAATLPAGVELTPDALAIEQVRVPDLDATYLTPQIADSEWWQAQPRMGRQVGQGELLPLSALTTTADQELRPVPITAAGEQSGLQIGSSVDLWHVSDANSGAQAQLIAEKVEVSGISEDNGPLSFSGAVSVTVLVPVTEIEAVLRAKSASGTIEIVAHLAGVQP